MWGMNLSRMCLIILFGCVVISRVNSLFIVFVQSIKIY